MSCIELFYSYHKQEVLAKYKRLEIGFIINEKPEILVQTPGMLSTVPYGEASAFQGKK